MWAYRVEGEVLFLALENPGCLQLSGECLIPRKHEVSTETGCSVDLPKDNRIPLDLRLSALPEGISHCQEGLH